MAQTTEPAWQKTADGEAILRPFKSAPYPHASREDGFKTKEGKTFPRDPHYVDSTVAIFIPKNFAAKDSVDYVVHFHGWGNHVSKVLEQYKLPQQLAAAKVNAILIVPQGPKDASDSGDGKLELDKDGFKNLVDEVTAFLNEQQKIQSKTIGHIALTAHSGGYKVTAAILDHGGLTDHITDVLLLDASYGSLDQFVAWCKASSDHRLVSLFTKHLEDENQQLIAMLASGGVSCTLIDEGHLPIAARSRTRLFVSTKLAHDEVPWKRDYFRLLLETSQLSK